MKAFIVVVLAILALGTQAVVHTPGDGKFLKALKRMANTEHLEGETPFEWFPRAAMEGAKEMGQPYKALGEWQCPTWDPNSGCAQAPDLYWRWMPLVVGSLGVAPNITELKWSSPCFATNVATMTTDILGIHVIHVEASQPIFTTAECIDHYMFATTEDIVSHEVKAQTGDTTATFDAHLLPANRDDTKEWFKLQGVRIFRYLDGANDTHDEFVATLSLFFPSDVIGPNVPDQKEILKFINDYAGIQYPFREDGILDLDEDLVADGTTLAVFRADGLATIQIWATGSHTNHIAMAMRINGTLHVVESTDKTSYWPNPNIQQTVWAEWFKLAYRANYSVILLPLKDEYQTMFEANKESVLEFINGSVGGPYGYHNYLFGFFDLPEGNLPFPASWQLFEILLSIFDLADPATGTKMWGQAFSQRVYGFPTNNTTVALSNAAWTEKGWNFGEMWAIPEQDSFVYFNGPSRVCDVYACTIYKVAGFFGNITDTIQCTEFQNSDHYQLNFFNVSGDRPAICQQTDPSNPFCQMTGEVSLTLNSPGTTTPYANMDQKCPSMPTAYWRPSDC